MLGKYSATKLYSPASFDFFFPQILPFIVDNI